MPPNLTLGWDGLARSHVDTEAGELSLTLTSGETVSIDLGRPSDGNVALGKKPIVYLDQNHWVAVAQALHSPDRLDARTRDAAVDLIERAEAREVLVPFSSGHLVETVPRGKQRRNVAFTMLTLSRGLQMRNPLDVRRQELSAALSGREPRCAGVFTLEPTVLFSEGSDVPTPAGFPAAWAELHRRITAASATIATMFEDADDPSEGPGPAARQRWLDAYRAVATSVHSGNLSAAETRSVAHQILFADLQQEIAHAAAAVAMQPDDFEAWLTSSAEADFERAPYVATLQEVLYPGCETATTIGRRMTSLTCSSFVAPRVTPTSS
jgi:hypothetical protein